MNNKILLQSIALDLKRVALGYHSGSIKMADRFLLEIMRRKTQLDISLLSDTVKKLLTHIDKIQQEKNFKKKADDALMYSNLFISFSK